MVHAGGAALIGPAPAGDAGRFAVVRDPTGVGFGLWQPGHRIGAEVVNEPGAWTMSALHTQDMERAASFYAAAFGWELEPVPQTPLALFRLPGYVGDETGPAIPRDVVAVVTASDDAGEVPPHWAVSFCVDDVDATADRAIALGGRLLIPPTEAAPARTALIADPQQGVISISASLS